MPAVSQTRVSQDVLARFAMVVTARRAPCRQQAPVSQRGNRTRWAATTCAWTTGGQLWTGCQWNAPDACLFRLSPPHSARLVADETGATSIEGTPELVAEVAVLGGAVGDGADFVGADDERLRGGVGYLGHTPFPTVVHRLSVSHRSWSCYLTFGEPLHRLSGISMVQTPSCSHHSPILGRAMLTVRSLSSITGGWWTWLRLCRKPSGRPNRGCLRAGDS